MYNIVSVAVGMQYEKEVQRLLKAYPQTIVITQRTSGVETSFKIPVLNGLATKCKFGLLIPENLKGPILFCDADLYPVKQDPLQYLKIKPETDVAYVIYPGKWHFPPRLKDFENAIQKTGKLNSGFMYFKNIDVCRDVCHKWHNEYMKRMNMHLNGIEKADITGEYDEPSLVYVLNKESYNLEFLDDRWNVWPTSKINKQEAYFVQEHLDNYTMYALTPGFKNDA
jgi:hypothetical protein